MNRTKVPYESFALPDGKTINKWEKNISYKKTYIVDQKHPQASDENPGTEEFPFATINKAARTLVPGEQVLVKNGIYREWVRPMAGGNDAQSMIKYAAYPGHKPIIRASKQINENWEKSEYNESNDCLHIWKMTLPLSFFYELSPLMVVNLTDSQFTGMPHFRYYYENFRGKEPYTLRSALLFANGERLRQLGDPKMISQTEDSFYVEESGRVIHVHLKGNLNPNECEMEVSQFSRCFAPALPGLHFISVTGFIMEHAGNSFAYPMAGALSPNYGHHWIIENNLVRQCNGIGIDVGNQLNAGGYDFYYPEGGGYIITNNIIEECGFGGLEGSHVENTVAEYNTIRNCCWHNTELYYENGGIKFLFNRNVLVHNNHIYNIRNANAIWMDWACENCRISSNVVHDITSIFGGIFVEASRVENIVDNNIIWDIEGNGVYQHDCDNLSIAHNIIGNCSQYGVKLWMNKGRDVVGAPSDCKNNKVYNNLFYQTNGSVYSINTLNKAWNNYISMESNNNSDRSGELRVSLFPKVEEKKLYPASGDEEQNAEELEEDGFLTDEATKIKIRANFDKVGLFIEIIEGEIPDEMIIDKLTIMKTEGKKICVISGIKRVSEDH